MKVLITLALIAGLYLFGKAIFNEYKDQENEKAAASKVEQQGPSDGLPGMPSTFQASLAAAQQGGAPALKEWLERYRPYLRDPKLAAIELDYVVLISRSDPQEGKRIYDSVRSRVPKTSPVYDRVKRLENTFGQ